MQHLAILMPLPTMYRIKASNLEFIHRRLIKIQMLATLPNYRFLKGEVLCALTY